jgi:hypothetical protein
MQPHISAEITQVMATTQWVLMAYNTSGVLPVWYKTMLGGQSQV